MDSISDPARAGRRDRKRAQRLIDTAFAERRITAAERTLRTQRIQAAHTRGDLAMLTRDLGLPGSAKLGAALDPAQLSSMRVGPTTATRTSGTMPGRPNTPTVDLSNVASKIRLFVILFVVGMFVVCGLGLAAIIPGILRASHVGPTSDPTSGSTADRGSVLPPTAAPAPASLHSAAGWTAFVKAIQEASGSTKVYDLVVYPTYASVGLDGKGAVERRFYRDGAWQDAATVRTPAQGTPVDVGLVKPAVIAGLVDETARHFHIAEPTGSYFIVTAITGVPRIMVYVQSDGASQYRAYGLDGRPLE